MKNAALYIITVLVWGSTWYAIEFQIGEVDILASVCYRFAIAAIIMWGFCLVRGVPLAIDLSQHKWIMLMALFNFSLNYATIYYSQAYLSSAMTCIAFSTMLLMNIFNTRLFFGRAISPQVWLGALLGIVGIVVLFWHDLSSNTFGLGDNSNDTLFGLGLAIAAAFIASLGNMVSVRNSQHSINVMTANAWGMSYGTIILFALVLLTDAEFGFSMAPAYLGSLLFLSIFGTVIAFASYYILLNNIGPERASYAIVLFPVVAVIISTLFEDFVWRSNTFLGFTLVIIGNAIVMTPMHKIPFLGKRLSASSG